MIAPLRCLCLALGAGLLGSFAAVSPAAAGQYPAPQTAVQVEGDAAVVAGNGCDADATVTWELRLNGQTHLTGNTIANTSGEFTIDFDGLDEALYEVVITCGERVQSPLFAIGENVIDKSRPAVEPGAPVNGTARYFLPGTEVTVTFESEPIHLTAVEAGVDGVARFQVQIPCDATEGDHHLVTRGTGVDGSPLSLRTPLSVSGQADCPETLSETGSNSMDLARGGAVVVGLGSLMVYAARKRRIRAARR